MFLYIDLGIKPLTISSRPNLSVVSISLSCRLLFLLHRLLCCNPFFSLPHSLLPSFLIYESPIITKIISSNLYSSSVHRKTCKFVSLYPLQKGHLLLVYIFGFLVFKLSIVDSSPFSNFITNVLFLLSLLLVLLDVILVPIHISRDHFQLVSNIICLFSHLRFLSSINQFTILFISFFFFTNF